MKLVTVKELSKFIRVKESTLYAWANNGLIPCHRLNSLLRFDLEEIEEWIKEPRHIPEQLFVMPVKSVKPQNIDTIIKNAVDAVKGKRYNKASGKPDRNQGLRKEV